MSAPGTMGGDPARPWLTFPLTQPPLPPICATQEVDAAEIQVQVCLYAFDLIYLNGEVSSGFACRCSEGQVPEPVVWGSFLTLPRH